MIRFRTGQSWRREPAGPPVDSLGLELEGVDLLAGASAERLDVIVPELISAIALLRSGEAELAEVAFPEVHWVLGLEREHSEVLLHVVSLARPARRLRPPLRVELDELATAAAQVGRQLLVDAGEAHLSAARRKALTRGLQSLKREARDSPKRARAELIAEVVAPAHGFGLELLDRANLSGRLSSADRGALTSLLAPGRVWLRAEGEAPIWSEERAVPFLFAHELARQGAELAHAIELGEESFAFEPGGSGARVTVRIREGTVEVRRTKHPLAAERLAREMYNLGLSLAPMLRRHHRLQAKNPYLEELQERCREGLSRFTEVRPSATARPARGRKEKAKKEAPIAPSGRLRKLRFEPLWTQERVGGEHGGRLLLSPQGPVVVSRARLAAISPRGELRFRRDASVGLAAGADGTALVADASRVMRFVGAEPSARWVRDHDGLAFGPELLRADGLLLTVAQDRAVLCFEELTGRELWRLAPFRSQRVHLAVQGHRALVSTDGGHLFGVELLDGQARYRVAAPLPFVGPTVAWGHRAVGVVGRRDSSGLVVVDADSGAVSWTCQLELGRPSRPLPLGKRVLIAGEREGQGVLICLSSDGKWIWERTLPQERAPLSLTKVGGAVLVVGSNGAGTLVDSEGQVEWRLGAAGEEPLQIAPAVVRGVALIPGHPVRAVDVHGGRVLGEVQVAPGLCDLQVDRKLNLYLLDDRGTVTAFHLRSHFAVVATPSTER